MACGAGVGMAGGAHQTRPPTRLVDHARGRGPIGLARGWVHRPNVSPTMQGKVTGMRLTLGTLIALLLLSLTGLVPSAAAPLAATCSPRPPVNVTVAATGNGALQATIGAATAAGVTLQQVTFGTLANALID